jgi:hypothetical protein
MMQKMTGIDKTLAVADLDKILVGKVIFKLHGNQHTINPLTTEQLFKFINILDEVQNTKHEGKTVEELIDKFHRLFSSVCPSITLEDVRDCSMNQVVGLLSLVIESATGRQTPLGDDGEVKKNLLQPKESRLVRRSWWRNIVSSLGASHNRP